MTNKQIRGGRILYILAAYGVAIAFFTLYRLIETWVYCAANHPDLEGLYSKALVMGFRFDTLIACYMLALPLLMVLVGELAHIRAKAYYAVAHHITLTLFIICFFACAADIPYFNNFFTHLNAFAVSWGDQAGTVLSMIVGEFAYIGFFLLFVALSVAYCFLMRWVYRRLMCCADGFLPLGWAIPLSLLLAFALLCGMRGRTPDRSPMRVGTAYFSNNAFINQIGLNPVFTFIKTLGDVSSDKNHPVELMDEASARPIAENERCVPLADLSDTVLLPSDINVVLVIMESMTVDKVGYFAGGESLTPNLDSLIRGSLHFTQAYSAGIHTYNGIYGTLYGHPAILSQHAMKRPIIYQMCGLPQALDAAGYSSIFFCTHKPEWDNMKGFLFANGYERMVSQLDYDPALATGTWGVQDHTMFDRAIDEIAALDTSRPFFATILTCSDHAPWVWPEGIDLLPRGDELKFDIVRYADWAIGRFMRQAALQPWFDNTLFVFVADHGIANFRERSVYDMSLSCHHIPLLFYAPSHIAPRRIDRLAQQIDIPATLLGMLPVADDSRTLGIDLLRQQRPYAFFSADDKVGVVDGEWFYVWRVLEGRESLYRYTDADPADYLSLQPDRAAAMQRYAFGMIQHSQTMLRNAETRCQ